MPYAGRNAGCVASQRKRLLSPGALTRLVWHRSSTAVELPTKLELFLGRSPDVAGQGFSIPGTVSSEFGKKELHSWRQGFYDRLIAHAERAAATLAAVSPSAVNSAAARGGTAERTPPPAKGTEEEAAVAGTDIKIENGYPKILAFAGKRQVLCRGRKVRCRLEKLLLWFVDDLTYRNRRHFVGVQSCLSPATRVSGQSSVFDLR